MHNPCRGGKTCARRQEKQALDSAQLGQGGEGGI